MYLRSLWRDQLCDSVVNLHRSHPAAEPKGRLGSLLDDLRVEGGVVRVGADLFDHLTG